MRVTGLIEAFRRTGAAAVMTVIEPRHEFAGGPPAGRHAGLVLPASEFDVAHDVLEDEQMMWVGGNLNF
jgi:hypothetical protein